MSQTPEWPPSPEAMHSLLPAFEFTAMVTSSDVGAVFFANQKSLERQVALKVFSPALAADPDFRRAFGNSSKLAAGLRHTNMIGLFDSGEVGGMLYLVMEFVPGKSLARSTKGHIVEFGQSLTIIDAISEGLAHAHDAGLVHGHLDNLSILLNQNAVPKIGNFGFGRAVHTDPQVAVPTHFTAPEVLANPAAASKSSDVYSLAALFHGLITGKSFSPQEPPPSAVCGCPPAVDAVLKRATDADPLKRYADARAFQTALKQATSKAVAITPAAPAASPPPTVPLPKSGFDTKLLFKIAIIIALLFAIKFTWEFQKKLRSDRDKQNTEILAKEKARKAEQAAAQAAADKAIADARNLRIPKAPDTTRPGYEKPVETTQQSLTRLRSALASGSRSEMPVGSVKKGDRTYLLIEEPMSWAAAALFAEEHGAHLANPESDLSWLDAELTQGRECWLGAARGEGESWVLCDGKPWSPPAQPSGSGLFLVSTKGNGVASADEGQPRPFVIEWHADGSNPGTLANQLAATRASLSGDKPLFPPGTVVSGERRYLFVPRLATWEEASEMAKDGGGHLLVSATADEIAEVVSLTRKTEAEDGIWLGGSLEDDHWKWITGETWNAAGWADDSDASEEGSALALLPGKGWIAMDRGDIASGFLIEWSSDEKAPRSETTAPAPGGKIAELNARVKELILAAAKKRDSDLASNAKKLSWDIDSFVRNLSGSGQDRWKTHAEAVKECIEGNRIVTGMIRERGISVSIEMAKLINFCAAKEAEYDARLEAECTKIRDAYVAKLTAIRDEAKAAGQPKVAADADDTIAEAEDLKSWLEDFDVDFSTPKADKIKEYYADGDENGTDSDDDNGNDDDE